MLGNIVEQAVDVIVNAANTKLAGGGGVDGAIHRAAGRELVEACQALPPVNDKGQRCPTGEVRVTDAFTLPARWVVHAVGPFYNEKYRQKAHDQLASAVRGALDAAADLGAASVALPAISTGAYRFPLDDAARISIDEAYRSLDAGASVREVRFVLFKPRFFDAFAQAVER
ncbi:MAG: macro domain-containing protein [Myxococcota bacterium]